MCSGCLSRSLMLSSSDEIYGNRGNMNIKIGYVVPDVRDYMTILVEFEGDGEK